MRKNRMPVILLTGHGDIPMAVNAMKNGAMDFIIKPYNAQYLVKQIQKSIALNIQLRCREPSKKETASVADLTKREKQILFLVSAGELNKQISVKLSIANSTVEFHRSRLMKKLGAKNLTELIKIHIRSQEIKE